jgi:fused signal recognition particle receptor
MFSFFSKKKVDESLIENLEEELIASDIGVPTALKIINSLKKTKLDKEIDLDELKNITKNILKEDIIDFCNKSPLLSDKKPFVIMLCGTNGGGKTTTIAKLTNLLKQKHSKILLAPCDTFRAGATEQLRMWAEKLSVSFFEPNNIKDPAAIAYKATEKAIEEQFDVLIVDTSGRLDGNANLMEELKKIEASIKKLYLSAPHESILVVDGTQGQIALQQAIGFGKTINLSGAIITKLDTSAKGGILVNIIKTLQIPIYYFGIGEKIDDITPFNVDTYLENLLSLEPKQYKEFTPYKIEEDFFTPTDESYLDTPSEDLEEALKNPSEDVLELLKKEDN